MSLSRSSLLRGAAALAAVTLPLAALAHPGADAGAHHGFLAGLLHPLTGLDHLAAMVAVGLWSGLNARRASDAAWAPLGFAAMLLVGALLGLTGTALPGVEPMIAASLLVLGLLVATRLRLSGPAGAALAGAFALFHGVAHGAELAAQGDAFATLAGMLAATLALHVAGLAAGLALRRTHAWAPRIAGAAGAGVALFGAALLAQLA